MYLGSGLGMYLPIAQKNSSCLVTEESPECGWGVAMLRCSLKRLNYLFGLASLLPGQGIIFNEPYLYFMFKALLTGSFRGFLPTAADI